MRWYHIVVITEKDNKRKVYIDGTEVSSNRVGSFTKDTLPGGIWIKI